MSVIRSSLEAAYPRNCKCDPECDIVDGPCVCAMNAKLHEAGVIPPEARFTDKRPRAWREMISRFFHG